MSPPSRRFLAIVALMSFALLLASLVGLTRRERERLDASIARLRAHRGTPFPDILVRTDDGRTSRLVALGEGFDRLIVVFTRSGCPRCQALLEDLESWKPVADPTIAVAIVEVGTADVSDRRRSGDGSRWAPVFDTDGAFATVLGGRVVPVMMVVDRDRTVRAVYIGEDESRNGLAWIDPPWATSRSGR